MKEPRGRHGLVSEVYGDWKQRNGGAKAHGDTSMQQHPVSLKDFQSDSSYRAGSVNRSFSPGNGPMPGSKMARRKKANDCGVQPAALPPQHLHQQYAELDETAQDSFHFLPCSQ